MFIDTHCHLNDAKFDSDLKEVITNAKKAGIKKIIVPSYDYYSSKRTLELSVRFSKVLYSAVGYHPYEAQHISSINPLEKLILNPNIVAVGEIGLDFHQYKGHPAVSKKNNQKWLFEKQCHLALKYNLPVIIHCREAFSDLFEILDGLPKTPRGVLHCFSGGLQDIRSARKKGLFIGIDGNITYSKHLQSILPQISLEYLVLETDAPYLTPIPKRGIRNEPKYLRYTAKAVSEIYGISVKDLADITRTNSEKLFFK